MPYDEYTLIKQHKENMKNEHLWLKQSGDSGKYDPYKGLYFPDLSHNFWSESRNSSCLIILVIQNFFFFF